MRCVVQEGDFGLFAVVAAVFVVKNDFGNAGVVKIDIEHHASGRTRMAASNKKVLKPPCATAATFSRV
jgi:hypothetical protein